MIPNYNDLTNYYRKTLRDSLLKPNEYDIVLQRMYDSSDSDLTRKNIQQQIDMHNEVQHNIDKYIGSVVRCLDNMFVYNNSVDSTMPCTDQHAYTNEQFTDLEHRLFGGEGSEEMAGAMYNKLVVQGNNLSKEMAEVNDDIIRTKRELYYVKTLKTKREYLVTLEEKQQRLLNKQESLSKDITELSAKKKDLSEYYAQLKEIADVERVINTLHKNKFYQGTLVNVYMACEIEVNRLKSGEIDSILSKQIKPSDIANLKDNLTTDKLFIKNIQIITSVKELIYKSELNEAYQHKRYNYNRYEDTPCFDLKSLAMMFTLSPDKLATRVNKTVYYGSVGYKVSKRLTNFTALPVNASNYNSLNTTKDIDTFAELYMAYSKAYFNRGLEGYYNEQAAKEVLDYEYRKANPRLFGDDYYISGAGSYRYR